ncbi:peptide synthetase [Streptococcus sanguinis]|uniref:Peptide synthetase n=1 Tax=Streptococcus sanguinis TaxID=1305 RepID=A0A7H8V880_STRSA|nr:peptide synthetase [Streptococcus sanguinis]
MSILKMFNDNFKKNPLKDVLISKSRRFTFKDINLLSNYLAKSLLNLTDKEIVPFYIEEVIYVLPIVLGIIKAGKIPLPITNSLSINKSLDRIMDVDFDTVISDKNQDYYLKDVDFLILPENDDEYIDDDNFTINLENKISYIICTSGTTGTPKKVFLTEDNISWLLNEFYNIVDFTSESKFLFTTPYTFDVSLTEILAPVFTGGTLVCFEADINSIINISKILNDEKISHLSLSPSFAETIIDTNESTIFDNLQVLCLAGEVFPGTLANKLRPTISKGCRVFNFYGPSETTIYTTYYELKNKQYNVVPIGKPIPGATIRVVPNRSDLKNQQGELWIGGQGVTDGYLLQPDLNSKKFTKINGERYYHTGDYVYFQGENLVFSSRIDNQVQVNGIRVELDEIKSLVDKVTSVDSSRVVFYKKKIYIFYVAQNEEKDRILKNLPSYLNPIVVKVDKFYLTQNRKLDVTKMLDKYYYNERFLDEDVIRKSILEILSQFGCVEVLDLDSLESVKFYLEIEDTFNIKVRESDIYKLKSIETTIEYVKDKMKGNPDNKHTNNINSDNRDLVNIEYNLSDSYLLKYADGIVDATPTQYRLYNNKQFRTVYFDISLKSIDCEELLRIKSLLKILSDKIDIFRMIIKKVDSGIEFRLIEKERYIPNIFILNRFPNNLILQEILDSKTCIPIPIIAVSTYDKIVRFYFPYHSIDSSSLNMLENIIYQAYEHKNNISSVKESSLYKFDQYKKSFLYTELPSDVLNKLPAVKDNLNFSVLKQGLQIFELPVNMDDSKDDVYLYTVYALCRCILLDYNILSISGGLSYDFRQFINFDAESLIGDIHKKIPFEVKLNENYQDFKLNFQNQLNLYGQGIDFSEMALRRGDSVGQLIKNRINNLSLSINYIGEALKIDDLVKQILANKFEKNFINIFSHKGKTYSVICSSIFKNNSYEIERNNEKIVATVSNEIL